MPYQKLQIVATVVRARRTDETPYGPEVHTFTRITTKSVSEEGEVREFNLFIDMIAKNGLGIKAADLAVGDKIMAEGELLKAAASINAEARPTGFVRFNAHRIVRVHADEPEFNEVTIQGNLGGEPESSFPEALGGLQATTFGVAVSKTWKNDKGERKESTMWFNVDAVDKTALSASTSLHKGDPILVTGMLRLSAYMGEDGEPRASYRIRNPWLHYVSKSKGAAAAAVAKTEEPEECPYGN